MEENTGQRRKRVKTTPSSGPKIYYAHGELLARATILFSLLYSSSAASPLGGVSIIICDAFWRFLVSSPLLGQKNNFALRNIGQDWKIIILLKRLWDFVHGQIIPTLVCYVTVLEPSKQASEYVALIYAEVR